MTLPTRLLRPGRRGTATTASSSLAVVVPTSSSSPIGNSSSSSSGMNSTSVGSCNNHHIPQQQQQHHHNMPPPLPVPQRHSSPPRRRRRQRPCGRKQWVLTMVPYTALIWILGRLTWTVRHFETTFRPTSTTVWMTTIPFDSSTSSSSSSSSSSSFNDRMTLHSNYNHHHNFNNNNNNNNIRKNKKKQHKNSNASLPFSYQTLLQEYHIPFVSSPSSSSSSSSVSSSVSSLSTEEEELLLLDPWMLVPRSSSSSSTDHYYERRRRRQTRPPPLPLFHHSTTTTFNTTSLAQLSLSWNDHGDVTTISMTNDDDPDNDSNSTHQNLNHPSPDPDWSDWCQRAHLTKHSRVVITNALSVAMGPPLTLFLYHVCHVPSIMMVDAMVPNLKRGRLVVLDTYVRTLVRSIPGLKWTVPTATAGLSKRTTTTPRSSGYHHHQNQNTTDQNGMNWLDSFRPTLVLHLEDERGWGQSQPASEWLDHITPTGHELYRIHNSILSLQQLLHYQQTRRTTHELSILHIILTEGTLSSSSLPLDQPPPHPMATWTRRINDMLAQYVGTVAAATTTQYPQQAPPTGTTYHRNQTTTLRVNQLQIPFTIFGPLVPNHNYYNSSASLYDVPSQTNQSTSSPLLYIDDAIVGVLKALQQQQQQQLPVVSGGARFRMTGSVSSSLPHYHARIKQQQLHDQFYRHHDMYPYGFMTGTTTTEPNRVATVITTTNETLSRRTYQTTVAPIDRFYGIHKTRFPCASTCWNEEWYDVNDSEEDRICDASVLDTIHPISRSITKHCTYVLYYVNLDVHWNKTLALPKEFVGKKLPKSSKLCRIAFVSRQSVMLRNLIKELYEKEEDVEKLLRNNNGKLVANGWSLIWVDGGNEEPHSTTNNIEVDTLLRIEPSRFFASKVKKAMYTDSEIIASTSDVAIQQILSNIDRPAHPHGHHTNDYRSGYDNIHRSIYHPPSRGRSVAFFASEMEEDRPKNLGEYIQRHLSDMTESDIKKSRPINFYKQMSHWVQSDTNRPLGDGIGVVLHVPWIWISMKFFVHDFQSTAARWFRCSWYDTYLYWGNDRMPGTEDLSLAYVFAKHRLLGTIGPGMEDGSWLPLQQHSNPSEPSDVGDDNINDIFLRIMSADSK